MINLLPQRQLRRARREYRLRLATLSSLALALILGSSAAFLVPSFLFARIERGTALATYERLKVTLNGGALEDSRTLSRTAELLEMVEQKSASVLPHVRQLLRARPQGVSLSRVAFEVREHAQFSITGVAETRDALLMFRDQLRDYDGFETVELPIGNLAKATAIEFSLTIVVAPSTP